MSKESKSSNPIKNIEEEKSKNFLYNINKKMEKHVGKIVILVILVCIIAAIYDLKTDEQYYINLDNPNLIKTETGYKEEIVFYSTVHNKKTAKGSIVGSKNLFRRHYIVSCYNEELAKYINLYISQKSYKKLEIGDNIKAKRVVYYTDSGLRLFTSDYAEKVDMNSQQENLIN